MLVLSRKKNESIVIPELGIELEIIEIQGNRVRLGIKAPKSVRILRSELVAARSEFETFPRTSDLGMDTTFATSQVA